MKVVMPRGARGTADLPSGALYVTTWQTVQETEHGCHLIVNCDDKDFPYQCGAEVEMVKLGGVVLLPLPCCLCCRRQVTRCIGLARMSCVSVKRVIT